MSQPSTLPRWAETATGTPAANITVPLSGEQDVGFTNGQTVVSSGKVNWLFRTIFDWLSYLKTGPLTVADGAAATPAYSFSSEPGTGAYRAGASDYRVALGGADALQVTTSGVTLPQGAVLKTTAPNAAVILQGNLNAADPNTETAIRSTTTRTAGFMLAIQNPAGASKLLVDYQGLLQLGNTTAIQPASMVTAITPNASWLSAGGPAYWKDATGAVRLKGTLTNNTGAATTTILSTVPLPAGFRPGATRTFVVSDTGFATPGTHVIQITTAGTISCALGDSIAATGVISLDGISFLAEA